MWSAIPSAGFPSSSEDATGEAEDKEEDADELSAVAVTSRLPLARDRWECIGGALGNAMSHRQLLHCHLADDVGTSRQEVIDQRGDLSGNMCMRIVTWSLMPYERNW